MTSSERRKPNYRRRFGWLGAFIVLLFGGYSAGWFYLADFLETRAGEAIRTFNAGDRQAECSNLSAEGFPFRIGLWCNSVRYEDARFAVVADHFRSAAQVYDPFHVVAELDSPAKLVLPYVGAVEAGWDNLRASVVADYDFPQRASVELRGLKAALGRNASFEIGTGEAHMRRNGENLDIAANFTGAVVDRSLLKGMALPPLNGALDLTLNNGVRIALAGGGSPRGWSGTIRSLSLSTGTDAGVSLSGPVSVDDQGLVNANLMVNVQKPGELAALVQAVFPEAGDLSSLANLGNTQLPLNITGGKASLMFLPLGTIPPL